MKRFLELPIRLSLSLIFWAGILLVWPLKKTKIGKAVIVWLDNFDLFIFGIKEDGLVQAIRDLEIYFDG